MEIDEMCKSSDMNQTTIIKTYKKRWLILGLFISYNSVSTFQGFEYSIITNIVMRYYNVSDVDVYWTTIVFMIVWPIFVLPVSFIMQRMGLRIAALIGATSTALGTAIKMLSISPDRFYVIMIGQSVTAVSQMFIQSLPQKIALTWFGPKESSTACALGIFGMFSGTAAGFLIPPMVVHNHDDLYEVGNDLQILCWTQAIICVPIVMLVIFYQPLLAPSLAQHYQREHVEKLSIKLFLQSVKKLMLNKPFLWHLVSNGCNYAIYGTIGALLNQIVLHYFKDAEADAGRMGLLMVISGMVFTVLIGIVLDKTHKYKESSVVAYIGSVISLGLFILALELRAMWMCYLTIALFGIFMNAYVPIGYELAAELTYPSPETTMTCILLASSQTLSTILTIALGQINTQFGPLCTASVGICILFIGTFTSIIVPGNRLFRQKAFRNGDCIDKEELEKIMLKDIPAADSSE